jgi:hypothetical protein
MGGVIMTLAILIFVWDDDFAFTNFAFNRSVSWWFGVLVSAAGFFRAFLPSEVSVLIHSMLHLLAVGT